jgi:nicotinamidase-related amidase
MTLNRIDRTFLDLVPELAQFAPPAAILDKRIYSPWSGTDLLPSLLSRGVDTIVVSGGETDVCVLASVLDAVDLGLRVVVVSDAVTGSSPQGHAAALDLMRLRFADQVELATTGAVIEAWR